jgi:transposase-like protein
MPTILIRLRDAGQFKAERPPNCPYCGNTILQSWGQVSRQVQDYQTQPADVHRYHCKKCDHTFRVYPQGVDRLGFTRRLRDIAALAWALGMSCRDVTALFEKLGVKTNRMAVWRGGKDLLERIKSRGKLETLNRYHLDQNFQPRISSRLGVVIVFELEPGNSAVLGVIDEYNPRRVKKWLDELIDARGIEVAVLDTGTLNEKYVMVRS